MKPQAYYRSLTKEMNNKGENISFFQGFHRRLWDVEIHETLTSKNLLPNHKLVDHIILHSLLGFSEYQLHVSGDPRQ